jgi:serine/threonine protein kinase/Tol biopolymer transport system component
MLFNAGTQLGRYSIQSLLGVGAMGEVYLARDLKLQRLVALKVLLPRHPDDPRNLRRFLKEARAASALNHPNVVQIYEIEEEQGFSFIVLEYVPGQTLRERLRGARLTPRESVEIAVQVSSALAAAHAAKIVHRDIKPENIMLTASGQIKVLDFGLAKLETGPDPKGHLMDATISQAESEPGLMVGTVSYMSPEQARGQTLDSRTDIWSLGIVLYEMLTRQLPFEGPTSTDVLAAILKQPVPPSPPINPAVNDILESIFAKALSKEIENRYQCIIDMQTDLVELKQLLLSVPDCAGFQPVRSDAEFKTRSEQEKPRSGSGAPVESRQSAAGEFRSLSSAEYVVSTIQRHKKLAGVSLVVLIAIIAVTLYGSVNSRRRSIGNGVRPLRRITFDQGLQSGATWSPDGRFIAYGCEGAGNYDICLQATTGGQVIHIVKSDEHEWQPGWSPDGNWIVFRSEVEGGGLYRVPAPLGGQPQKISSFGYSPQWSPDGTRILFLRQGMRLSERPRIYVTNGDGSTTPREVLTGPSGDEGGVRRGAVTWHPDGLRVSYWGEDKQFWTVPIDGGTSIKSEVSEEVRRGIEQNHMELGAFRWSPAGDAVYLEARSEGLLNIWRVGVDPKTLKWISGPERLTTSGGQDTDIALSPDGTKLAFTTKMQGTRIWLYPFDAQRGRLKSEGQPITPPDVDAWSPDLSPDGKKLIYSVYKQGMIKRELRERVLQTGEERKIKEVERRYPFYPRWSPDSTMIAYSPIQGYPNGKFSGSISLLNTRSGDEQPLASVATNSEEPWRDYMSDWSADGRWVFASSDRGSPERWYIAIFPIAEAPHAELKMHEVMRDPNSNLWSPRISPDGKWICFLKQNPTETASSVLYVANSSGGAMIRVTSENAWADKPRWSPDGKTIYFVYNRDVTYNRESYFINVWGIRFDPVEGKPVGDPFRVTMLNTPSKMVGTPLSSLDITLDENWLALPITEVSGYISVIENLGSNSLPSTAAGK